MNKTCTSLEQSKKLAEILPLESADMHWQYIEEDNGQLQWFCFSKDFSINQYDKVPAWSLTTLLDIIPQEISNGECIINITEGRDYRWVLTYDYYKNRKFSYYGLSTGADNLVDACCEMILKLHERKIGFGN